MPIIFPLPRNCQSTNSPTFWVVVCTFNRCLSCSVNQFILVLLAFVIRTFSDQWSADSTTHILSGSDSFSHCLKSSCKRVSKTRRTISTGVMSNNLGTYLDECEKVAMRVVCHPSFANSSSSRTLLNMLKNLAFQPCASLQRT